MNRNWSELEKRHRAFWACADVDRPLVGILHHLYVDTALVAASMGEGELTPDRVRLAPVLAEYDKVVRARELIGDDVLAWGEPPLGIPWLEAICGCRVIVPDGKSIWPEPPANGSRITDISFSPQNPWFQKLVEVMQAVVAHANGRYAVSMSHMRGPTDILVALLGSEQFSLMFYEDPDHLSRLAQQAAAVWLAVARAEAEIVPPYYGGYVARQFGLWSPELSVWLQDDTSGMISAGHYRQFFMGPMREMSVFPYGVLHLHVPSLHIAEMLAEVSNIRAINVYFDSAVHSLQEAMPVLRRLQARGMPLILAKTVYDGFTMEEYAEILDGLSPRGLSVHLDAKSVDEGRAVMAYVRSVGRPTGTGCCG